MSRGRAVLRVIGRMVPRYALGVVLSAVLASCGGHPLVPAPSPVETTPAPQPAPVPTPAPQPTRDPSRFQQAFWDCFVHDACDHPGSAMPLRRWTSAPHLYVRTIDEAGVPMDFATINTVITAMGDVASTWSGGQFGLAGIEQGTDSRAGQSGWITVIWPHPSAGAFCGLASIAVDGGTISLNYLRPEGCGCGASKMRTRTARHELGHAFGYYHTDNDLDVMKNGVNGCAETLPSPREVYHAELAYRSPVGTTTALPARVIAPTMIID